MEVFVPFKKVVVFLVVFLVVVVVVVVAKKHTRLSRYFVIPQEDGSQSSCFVTLTYDFLHSKNLDLSQ